MKQLPRLRSRQSGVLLVSSLLLLLVITILGLGMFRSVGSEERIAGNQREKQRALHAAESAQQYAEWWLTSGTNAASAPVVCANLLNANLGQGRICSNKLPTVVGNVSNVPWQNGGVDVGVSYTPPNMTVTHSSDVDTYYTAPRSYISDLGKAATGQGEIYQIDAVGYGGTQTAVAIVESTFSVYVSSWSVE
jgi:type IV pilus assembly protein PilX